MSGWKDKPRLVTCVTCDVEISDAEGVQNIEKIFHLFDAYGIKATFFLLLSPQAIGLFENSGILSHLDKHEFGLHIHWGLSEGSDLSRSRGMRWIPFELLDREMKHGLERCKMLGFRPRSFRAGGLCQTTEGLKLIARYGFHVDSSVASGLNETDGYFQGHRRIPFRSWYFPSKRGYDIAAWRSEDRVGVLEIPVTRLVPSSREWYPYTLSPAICHRSLLCLPEIIVHEWLLKSFWERPLVITPVLHSWGDNLEGDFDAFLARLSKMIRLLLGKGFHPLTVSELFDLLAK